MPRVKSSNKQLIEIPNWQNADEVLREIGDMQLQLKSMESYSKKAIDEEKEKLAANSKPIQEKIKQDIESLEAFCVNNKKDFEGKSRKLNFGILGWRKSTAIVVGKDTLGYIKRVFTGKMLATLIRVKETVNKDALAELTDGQLEEIEAQRKVKEVFFAEPALPSAAEI